MRYQLIFVTFSGMSSLVEQFIKLLKAFFIPNPKIIAITDRGRVNVSNTIQTGTKDWVASLYEGLKILRKSEASPDYVLLILDDLVPIRPVDVSLVNANFEIMRSQGWKKLSFFIDDPSEHMLETIHIGSSLFYKIPRASSTAQSLFVWYNSLQVAIWESSYLYGVCGSAIEQNISDPWRFEHLVTDQDHYVSTYRWPSEFQGLHFMRNINLRAVSRIQGQLKIRAVFWIYYIKQFPKQIIWRLKMKFKK